MQLQEVFARYPREITELRRFLLQAGVPVQKEYVASYMADRLAQDRRFHRDLMSYLWVLLDEHPAQLGAAELLGILAVASAGIPNASQMEEDDAHDLLRFVMESRRALGSAERPQARQERTATPPAPNLPQAPASASELAEARVPTPTLRESPVAEAKLPPRPAEVPASPTPVQTSPQPSAERPASSQKEASQPRATPVRASAERAVLQREESPLQPAHTAAEASWLAPEAAGPEVKERKRRRLVYAFSGACVLALLVGGYGLLHHPEPSVRTPVSAPIEQGSSTASPIETATPRDRSDVGFANSPRERSESAEALPGTRLRSGFPAQRPYPATPTGRPPLPSEREASRVSPTFAPSATVAPQPNVTRSDAARSSSISAAATAAPIVRTGPATTAIPAAGVTLRTNRPTSGVPQAVPASTLSRQLDSPKMPVYANDPDVTASGKPYPRLRHRNSSGALQENDPELVAEMHAPNLTGAGSGSRSAVSVPAGVVRGTCLGMMAGNLMYSPTPAYPQAAAAARVQGEVKIQATIDRDGSVSSARVVSGPPLLRDAALDAVQHWRYKPYTSGGKPSPTGTMAVLEFQLQ